MRQHAEMKDVVVGEMEEKEKGKGGGAVYRGVASHSLEVALNKGVFEPRANAGEKRKRGPCHGLVQDLLRHLIFGAAEVCVCVYVRVFMCVCVYVCVCVWGEGMESAFGVCGVCVRAMCVNLEWGGGVRENETRE